MSKRVDPLAELSYLGHREVPTRFSSLTNHMNCISSVPAEERVVATDDGTSGHFPAPILEQKALLWMIENSRQITLPKIW